jgi:7-carboxy-7-deazaguanine synthase
METTYRLAALFYSVQGEGANSGKAAVFVRFSFCNLKCPWCDTKFDYVLYEYTQSQLVEEICKHSAQLVIFTGGEPSLWLDKGLIDALHERERICAIETNGTNDVSGLGLDWITVSPKSKDGGSIKPEDWKQRTGDELKVVFPDAFNLDLLFADEGFKHYWISPTRGDITEDLNLEKAIDFVKTYPRWRLNIQAHKVWNVE